MVCYEKVMEFRMGEFEDSFSDWLPFVLEPDSYPVEIKPVRHTPDPGYQLRAERTYSAVKGGRG